MSSKINMDSNKDSISVDKMSKGFNYSAKVYLNGSNDPDDTSEKMLIRLKMYMDKLKVEYDGFNPNAPY